MIGFTANIDFNAAPIKKAVSDAQFKNFAHAAASISKDVKSTLEKADGASAPGSPPHTHRGQFLKRAVRWDATKEDAVIGPMASVVGLVGKVHEMGGSFHGQSYPERPYMLPALLRAIPRFADSWKGSVT
jgi:hypothetical protein